MPSDLGNVIRFGGLDISVDGSSRIINDETRFRSGFPATLTPCVLGVSAIVSLARIIVGINHNLAYYAGFQHGTVFTQHIFVMGESISPSRAVDLW